MSPQTCAADFIPDTVVLRGGTLEAITKCLEGGAYTGRLSLLWTCGGFGHMLGQCRGNSLDASP